MTRATPIKFAAVTLVHALLLTTGVATGPDRPPAGPPRARAPPKSFST